MEQNRDDHQGEAWRALQSNGVTPAPSVSVFSREEADQNRLLYLDMLSDAVLLIDRDRVFTERLDKLRDRLRVLGSRRVRFDGAWYWDLKPDLRLGETVIL